MLVNCAWRGFALFSTRNSTADRYTAAQASAAKPATAKTPAATLRPVGQLDIGSDATPLMAPPPPHRRQRAERAARRGS